MFLVVLSFLSIGHASDDPPPPAAEACGVSSTPPPWPYPIYLPDPADLPLIVVVNHGGETLCAFYGELEDPFGGPVTDGGPLGPIPPFGVVEFPAPDVDGPTGFSCTGDCTVSIVY